MAVNGFFSLFSNQRPTAGPRMHSRFGNKGLVQRIRRISKIGFNAFSLERFIHRASTRLKGWGSGLRCGAFRQNAASYGELSVCITRTIMRRIRII